jgi:GT2 family glycosyltransferase
VPHRLVAIVVTHNRLDQLRVTLARLLEADAETLAGVVVVDNVSTDGTPEWLATQDDPRLAVLRSETNLGGAGGFERGIGHAMDHLSPDWVVVMDDDARPEPGALARFHALAPRDDAALAAAVYYPDGRICEMNRPSVNPFWQPGIFLRTLLGKGRDGYHIAPSDYETDRPRPIDLTSFVGLFLPGSAIRAAGLPDGRLFLYGDDVIYTLGLRKRGIAILFDPRVRFEHDCTTFANDRRRAHKPLWKAYYNYRNGLIMYRAAAGWLFWPLLLLVVPKWALLGRNHAGQRRVFYRLLRAAVWDGLRGDLSRGHEAVVRLAE